MNPQSYQPGGTIYEWVKSVRGQAAADRLADAYVKDPYGPEVDKIVSDARTGNTANQYDERGTAGIFFDQVTTDPLAAPLESANRQLGLVVWNVIKNPFVLAIVVGVIAWKLGLFKNLLRK